MDEEAKVEATALNHRAILKYRELGVPYFLICEICWASVSRKLETAWSHAEAGPFAPALEQENGHL